MIPDLIDAGMQLGEFVDLGLTVALFVGLLGVVLTVVGGLGIARARLAQAADTADVLVRGVE